MENTYETPRLLDEYLLFHYGTAAEVLPWEFGPGEALHFPVRTVTELTDGSPCQTALDLGCAVGRSTFELSRFCRQVTGIDYSHSFIHAARELRRTGSLSFTCHEEGAITRPLIAHLPPGCQPERVAFEQGDAMHLREDMGDFDLVHAANLLCRLSNPGLLLRRFPSLVRPGGTLVLTTPCTWLTRFTPASQWPSGRTIDWLHTALDPDFEWKKSADLPFLIREHARKFQWTVALGTVWQRRP